MLADRAVPPPSMLVGTARVTYTLSDEERARFTRTLRRWGVSDEGIAATLRDATFPRGMVDISPIGRREPRHVAIVIDEDRDPDLRRLFEWREGLDDQTLDDQWEVAPSGPNIRVVINPAGHAALLRLPVAIVRPTPLRRNYLFLIHLLAPVLAQLQRPGTRLLLAPQAVALDAQQPSGPDSLSRTLQHCLLVGTTATPLGNLQTALDRLPSSRPRPLRRR